MNTNFYVSLAPHMHSGDSIERKMYQVLLALVPAFLVSLLVFGWGAIIVTTLSAGACVLFEYLIQKYVLKVDPTIKDGSALVTGVLLAFNLPSNLPFWIVLIGALVAIGVAKQTFGGLGNNPFNPAIVARVFLLVSFPAQMTSWPLPMQHGYVDALTGATPLTVFKNHLGNLPDTWSMVAGTIGGSLGEVSAIALLVGGGYLLIRRIISWHIPVSILASVFIFTFILGMLSPDTYHTALTTSLIVSAFRFSLFHLLSGGLLLGAFFMATDYVTSPMIKKGQLIYGTGIGIITVLIRVFGIYPEGLSFAIFIMNGVTPLINLYIKPKRFGEVRQ